jgi:hypothetical protein
VDLNFDINRMVKPKSRDDAVLVMKEALLELEFINEILDKAIANLKDSQGNTP